MNVKSVDKQSIEEATAEAMARPMGFDPKDRITYIRDHVRNIQHEMAQGEHVNSITARHADFARDYKELFKKVVQKEDLGPLNTMFGALEKMSQGSLSQHEASVIVGQKLVDKFVKPQLNGSSPNTSGR
jgi:hypothetical protein